MAVDLIAAQAQRTPDRVAVAWSGGSPWTYAELLAKADAIAHGLLERGVARGELVGVHMPRRPDMLAAVLGVMRAGAAYLPLDPVFPAERIRFMAEHAGVHHLLVWDAAGAPEPPIPGTRLFELAHVDAGSPYRGGLPVIGVDDLAYVLYTSGSTGKPKGVRILQRNLVNFLASMRQAPGIRADDRLGAFTTLSFDIAALELYLPLLVGACVVIATRAEQTDPAAAAALIREQGITMLQTTPTLLKLLVGSDRVQEMHGLKLLVGGEALPRDLAETILHECSELWNMYGPTETTVWSTIHRVDHGTGAVPLGGPVANTDIHVLDESRSEVADGEIGEIWIGGAGVADGYLHDPERTAERFMPNPFAADGSRIYRTGDLGSLRGGVLYFHGRTDDQIKLNGYRIEPGEIEAAALDEPGVRQAVAVARDLGEHDTRLVLYVVADPAPGLTSRLRDALHARLPAYMLPRYIEILDALPRTPNGKIDRKALPLPGALLEQQPAPAEAKPGLLESAMIEIWRDVLKVRKVGLHDDFFELGGDSLLAVRVFERMQALTGVNLPLATLLSSPTVAAQAAAFRAAGAEEPHATVATVDTVVAPDPWSPLVPIQPRGKRPPLFLVHALGGNVLNYVPLARGLGADQPVYGLQALGVDGLTPPVGSLPMMAACYVAEIQRVQPHGPYFLAGGSMGGLIAYEIAQQLREQGEPIGLLAMMDTYGPGCWRKQPSLRVPSSLRVASSLVWKPMRLLDALRVRRARAVGRALPHALRARELERVHYAALVAYAPRPYAGPLVLFRGMEQPEGARHAETLGWRDSVAGGIEVVELPGNHDNLIEQPELLHQLRRVLERTQTTARP
ncbi:MAG TPA: amino acid adenylation domain-containing protein [Rhodanobacteraceae bacterium]|nr:amino acid adenylation domain-containing protein [Rhodanobacteraceae bacterium]